MTTGLIWFDLTQMKRGRNKILLWRSAAVCDSTSRSNVRTFSRAGLFLAPVAIHVAAAGLRHSRAPPKGAKFETSNNQYRTPEEARGRSANSLLWPLHRVLSLGLPSGVGVLVETRNNPSLVCHLICFRVVRCLLILPFRASLSMVGGATAAWKQCAGRDYECERFLHGVI